MVKKQNAHTEVSFLAANAKTASLLLTRQGSMGFGLLSGKEEVRERRIGHLLDLKSGMD